MNHILLLQAADSTGIMSQASTEQEVTIFHLMMKGGFFMIPIAILSVIAIYIFVERLIVLRKAGSNPENFFSRVKELITGGNIEGAKLLCRQTNSPISLMIDKGISRLGSSLKMIDVSIENVGKLEIFKLEKGLATLAAISGAAPMLGFLGTVTGMIKAFIAIAHEQGNVSPALLAGGIYEAMVTTAAGLIVGIPAYIGYNYLVTKVSTIVHQMERISVEFIDMLQEPK